VEKHQWQHLDTAPIVEAVFDIRTSLQPGIRATAFEPIFAELKELYPNKEELHTVEIKHAVAANSSPVDPPVAKDELVGFRFKSADNTKLVQFRLDGFSFNHLKPYPKWDVFYAEAWHYWTLYSSLVRPNEIKRIALRYINRAEFPMRHRIDHIIRKPPTFDKAVPGEMDAFFFQAQLKSKETEDVSATVIQFTEPLGDPKGFDYVLDIDVSKSGNFVTADEKLFKQYFEELRDFKNGIFFNTLTSKAIEPWI